MYLHESHTVGDFLTLSGFLAVIYGYPVVVADQQQQQQQQLQQQQQQQRNYSKRKKKKYQRRRQAESASVSVMNLLSSLRP